MLNGGNEMLSKGSVSRVAVSVAMLTTMAAVVVGSYAGSSGATSDNVASSHGSTTTEPAVTSCHLKGGISHVMEIFFDNVHFFRDNPNVPCLTSRRCRPAEQFIEKNGTLLSNNHTPLIAHTADDSVTTYTGLYGDRAGMPMLERLPDLQRGRYDRSGRVVRVLDRPDVRRGEHSAPWSRHQPLHGLFARPRPPHRHARSLRTRRPRRRGCLSLVRAATSVASPSANMELENPSVDIPKVFGPNAPRPAASRRPGPVQRPGNGRLHRSRDPLRKRCIVCASAKAVKYGEATPTPSAVPDLLPDEPGGYDGYQVLFGSKYIAPGPRRRDADDLTHNGYEVTNAAGNLVDENGNQIDGAYLNDYPGFPGFGSINASQTPGLHGRHAGGRGSGHLRLHLRHPRQRLHPGFVGYR